MCYATCETTADLHNIRITKTMAVITNAFRRNNTSQSELLTTHLAGISVFESSNFINGYQQMLSIAILIEHQPLLPLYCRF